ncbi:MAG TPA: glycosyltransferase family 4 protein [Desulfomonilaceae bacterium]|nr:glycosyltransferase family 4 protein [Desulfomonilaceae bacterium]
MERRGLVLSAVSETDRSAYAHRVAKLAECLMQRGIACDFFFMPDHPPLDTETTASLFMPFWLGSLRKYDFIYCGGEESAQALFFCRKFIKGRIILDIHGDLLAQSALATEVESGGRKRSASARVKLIHAMGMTLADHVLTVCTPQTEALATSGMPRDKISLVRNGVDLEFFRFLPQPENPEFTFAYVGEFQVWQGIHNLISAFEKFRNSSARLLLVGFRPEDGAIKDTFRKKFGSRVNLLDRTNRESLVDILKSVSILIIPRIRHPAILHAFPTKFAEYAALGRPILVNDVDETADFVRAYECGFVSDPSPDCLAETMLAASLTPFRELQEMGKRSRSMAEENFSWDNIGRKYEVVVRKLIAAEFGPDMTS